MNLVGKIFVVLIFVMSLVFASFSIMVFATHKNWRDEITRAAATGKQGLGWQKRLEESVKERDRLKAEIDQLTAKLSAEKAAKIAAVAKMESTNQALQKELQTATADLTAKAATLATNTTTLAAAQANLSNLTNENKGLRDNLVIANRDADEQLKKATAATDAEAKAQLQLSILKEREIQLAGQVAKARKLLQSVGMNLETDERDPLDVRGIVLAVSNNELELSVGGDDGVRNNLEFDVFRGANYIGRIRVIRTNSDKAVAVVMPEFLQSPIQRGDNVASRLKT